MQNLKELSKPINNAQIRETFAKDDQRWSSFIVGTRFGYGIHTIFNLMSMCDVISSKEDAMKVAILTNLRMWGFRIIYDEVYKMYDFFCTLDFPISADLAKSKYLMHSLSRKNKASQK